LAAILAADVAGYSRLMGADEEGTLARLKAHRSILLGPKIEEHKGRIVKTTGDGMLVEFASVIEALRCAIEIQRGMSVRNAGLSVDERIEFRVGINVGDIITDADDIYGDGVNIAARLETMAETGGICVSGRVQEDARGKLDIAFEDAGEQQLKNIAWPVRVYRVRLGSGAVAQRPALALPNKPSIAVLAFQNLSADPEQEYFADGIVEDIITALSRLRWLFVIARNSSFTYKGRAVDVKQVGRELGVRYVLEGSVRKASARIRITGQLIDAGTGAHLWADRFDGALEDIFELQDQVTTRVISAIAPKLEQAEIERSRHKPTESLSAYDCFLRGVACVHLWTKQANEEALGLFNRATELDPNFAAAYGMGARCYCQRKGSGWASDRASEIAETTRLAHRAVELGNDDAVALSTAGFGLAFVVGELDDGAALIERGLTLNPNYAWALLFSGFVKVWQGEPEDAIRRLEQAMRLSPHDQHLFAMRGAIAMAHFIAGRFGEALAWAQASAREKPDFMATTCVVAASAALAGQPGEAAKAIAYLRQREPTMRIANLDNWIPLQRPQAKAKWEEGMRKAGLPE
jgi:adenylate cyclase